MIQVFGERKSGRRRAWLVSSALLLSLAGGGFWENLGQPQSTQQTEATGCTVFAGRAGSIPCASGNDPQTREIRRVIGTTVTGCILGLIFVGPEGVVPGCVSSAAGNIPW